MRFEYVQNNYMINYYYQISNVLNVLFVLQIKEK